MAKEINNFYKKKLQRITAAAEPKRVMNREAFCSDMVKIYRNFEIAKLLAIFNSLYLQGWNKLLY
jgi:hypothetical protein